jgi:hypothetical protein
MAEPRSGFRALMYGYIIRVFPVVSLAGFVVSAYGWLRLYQYFKKKMLLPALGGVLTIVALNIALTMLPGQQSPPISSNMTASEMVDALTLLDQQLASPLTTLTIIIPAASLVMEAIGLIALRRALAGRLPVGALVLLLFYTALLSSSITLIPRVESSVRSVRDSLATGSINTTVALSMLSEAYSPYNILDFAVVFSSLLAYIVLAYAFYKLGKTEVE